MTPRSTRAVYERGKGEINRRRLKELVDEGTRPPGVLIYRREQAIGWCSVEPRESFSSLSRSRILAPVDDQQVWSIVCLFVARDHRGCGVSKLLVAGAVEHAASLGARIIEAYPVEPKTSPMPAPFAYTGLASTFRAEGFLEVARRSPTRPVMRKSIGGPG